MSSSKGKKGPFVDPLDPFERGLEAVRSLGHHTGKGTQREAGEAAKTALAQMFGFKKSTEEPSAETTAQTEVQELAQQTDGRVIFNSKHHKPSEKTPIHADKAPQHRQEAAIDYHGRFRNEIVHSRERASKGEMNEMRQNIEQIKKELSKLIESSHILKLEFAEVSVEQTVNVGAYQLNFFEWMLAVIRSAREKVEDSNAWLGTVKGKGAKKDYWGMFKKHGTTFGLSGERSVATSVG